MGDVVKRGSREQPRYYVRFLDADGTRRMKLAKGATRLAQARVQLADAEKRVRDGLPGMPDRPVLAPAAGLTVAELGAKFCAEYSSPKLKDPADYRKEALSVFNVRITPFLGERAAASITNLDVEKLRDWVAAPKPGGLSLSPASANLTLACLSKCFTWARKQGLVDVDPPTKGVERFRTRPSLDYLSREEVPKLLEHARLRAPDVYPMIATAVYAGLRKGELYGLRWTDIALDRAQLMVARSYMLLPKSGEPRPIPLNPELVIILREWKEKCPKTHGGLVFPLDGGMAASTDMAGLEELMVAAGVHVPDGKVWHALRHSFASHFMMAGGSILTLQELLGHSDITMTLVYAHLAPDFLAADIKRMSFAPPVPATVSKLHA